MLHEYRDLIAELRQSDNHFARLFNEHNALDEEINAWRATLPSRRTVIRTSNAKNGKNWR